MSEDSSQAFRRSDALNKACGLLAFAIWPWALGAAHWALAPSTLSEGGQKAHAFRARGKPDTVVIGDSRSARLDPAPFESRGWRYFNFSTSGVCPEDLALQLQYALAHGAIKRVVFGASFEQFAQQQPYAFARLPASEAFRPFSLESLGHPAFPGSRSRQRIGTLIRHLLPIGSAASTWRYYASGAAPSSFDEKGTARYTRIQQDIASGQYDFLHQRNPNLYFDRTDSQRGFLIAGRLSAQTMRLYSALLNELRRRSITCVIFETSRTQAYQTLIDKDPKLLKLQLAWRAYLRGEAHGSVTFLDISKTSPCYAEADFFDAVHHLGKTGTHLSNLLAEELERTE